MTMAWSFCQQSAKHIIIYIYIYVVLSSHVPCLSLLYFGIFIVTGFLHRITKEFIHCRLRDDDTFLLLCLCNFFFFGLIMVQNQTFIEDPKLLKTNKLQEVFCLSI